MHKIHIICGQDKPQNIDVNSSIFWWDKVENTHNEHSVPKYCKDNLINLRQELVEFIHNIGERIIHGKSLYKWFYANDRLSMWWCSSLFEKHPLLIPELYEVLKLLSFEHMLNGLEQHKVEIVLHNANNELHQSIKQFCSQKNIVFSHANPKISAKNLCEVTLKKIVQKLKCNVLFQVCVTKLRFMHWLLFIRLPIKYNKQIRPSKPCVTMVAYYPTEQADKLNNDEFSSPYWQSLQKTITNAQKSINWLFIRINSPTTTFKQAIKNITQFNNKIDGSSFHFAEEFLSFADIWQALLRYVNICFTSYKLSKSIQPHFMLGSMNIWAYLRIYYAKSFQSWLCLERCLQRRAMLSYVAWAGVQEWTLFPLENCPWEKMLTEAIKHNNCGKVYGAQHSVVRQADFRYFDSPKFYHSVITKDFLPHKILVNGEAAYNALLAGKVPEHLLLKVEALRYVYLAKYATMATQNKTQCNTNSKQLIVVTSFFPKLMDEHIQLLAAWLKEYATNSWQIIIKPHPYCSVNKAIKKHVPNAQQLNITNKSIDGLLNDAKNNSITIWVAHDTTVILEALYAGIPLIIQNEGHGFDFCPAQGIDGLKYVYTCKDVQNALEADQILPFNEHFFYLNSNLEKWKQLLNL